jgi:chorismate dehydratase
MSGIRVGAVSYLNTRPLIEDLTSFSSDIQLSLDLPSRLADQLRAGQLDVGLIPVIEYFRSGDYTVLPNIAIASRGPVLSVTLFSKVPWNEIRTLSLDVGSRTSAALTQVLLQKRYGIRPEVSPLPIHQDAENLKTDAVLLIGDRAMKACLPGFPFAFDLGQEWFDWTGLPFVFAVWAVRKGVELGESAEAFYRAKRHGLARVGVIAQRESVALELDAGFCRRYLNHIIQFDLGPREEAGLRQYYSLASELGFAPKGVDLEYYHSPSLVQSR